MCRRVLPLLIFSIITIAYSYSATQTDWSGGSGVFGPVIEWIDQYCTCSNIDHYSSIGSVSLMFEALPAVIRHEITAPHINDICTADIDGDGDDDILSMSGSDVNKINWWEFVNGTDESWIEHTVDSTFDIPTNVFSGDFDGDGDIDVLGSSFYHDKISWWENVDGAGTLWLEHMVNDSFDGVRSPYAADVDGDGDTDILACSYYSDEICWWENTDGSGMSWTQITIAATIINGPRDINACDVDGDGDIDVIGAGYLSNDICWWENMDGSGSSWTWHTIDYFGGAYSVYSSDVDGDGDLDILGTARLANEICWWENLNGTGMNWYKHVVADNYPGAISVYADDIDADGDMDIAGSGIPNPYYGYMDWWENTGEGVPWEKHWVGGLMYGSVCASDVDADGDIDLLAATPGPWGICWWEVVGYPSEGSLESSILDTQMEPVWNYLDWNSQIPEGTSVSCQVRASANYKDMGDWSDYLQSPCPLEGVLTDSDRYVQYKVLFQTSTHDSTPTLNDITVSWNPVSIGDRSEPIPPEIALLPVAPNPSAGSPFVRFVLPESASVEISIFDLSGRLISDIPGDEYLSGFHEILPGDISSGVYFLRMISGDFSATRRFIVIR